MVDSLTPFTDSAFSYASGKIILVGEHAVVYGSKAIAAPIDAGVRVAVCKLSKDALEQKKGPLLRGIGLFFGDVFLGDKSFSSHLFYKVLDYLVTVFGDKVRELSIVVEGDLMPGTGLGSSAALSVALIKGVYRYYSWELSESELFEHVDKLETIFHNRPSGIDHTVIIKSKVISFKKENDKINFCELNLKSPLNLVIASLGPHIGTKNAVQQLNERRQRHSKAYDRVFKEIDFLAHEMEKGLSEGKISLVGELMNITQGYLNALGVSSPSIEKLCFIARQHGALGVKLTGAGCGGAVIALAQGNTKEIENAFIAAGCKSFTSIVPAS